MTKNPIETDMDSSKNNVKMSLQHKKTFLTLLIINKHKKSTKTSTNYTEVPFFLSDWQKLKV